jgi:hypothetical protein
MYLLKHIYIGVNLVNNQLIVALVLTTSAYLVSLSAFSGTTSQTPVQLRVAITASNGHLNTNLFYSNIGKYNVSADFIQPLSLHICNVSGMKVADECRGNTKRGSGLPNHSANRLRITITGGVVYKKANI